jgi:hypothetical protein
MLQEISSLYREMQAALDRWQQHKFLVLWAEKEDLAGRIDHLELEKGTCQADIQKAIDDIVQAEATLESKRKRRDELVAARSNSDVFHEDQRLTEQKRESGIDPKWLSRTATAHNAGSQKRNTKFESPLSAHSGAGRYRRDTISQENIRGCFRCLCNI